MKKNNAYITKIAGLMDVLGEKQYLQDIEKNVINSSREWNFIKRKVIQIAVKSPASRIVVHSPIKEFCLSKGED